MACVVHPDPGPIANVQVWEQRASEFWRFVACFFVTIHFSDAPVTLRRSSFQKWRRADAPIFFKPYGMWHNCWMAKTIDKTRFLTEFPVLSPNFHFHNDRSLSSNKTREAASHWLEDCKLLSLQNHDEAHHFLPRGWMSPEQKICCYVFTLSLSQWPEVVFQHNKLLSSKSGEADHLLPTAW